MSRTQNKLFHFYCQSGFTLLTTLYNMFYWPNNYSTSACFDYRSCTNNYLIAREIYILIRHCSQPWRIVMAECKLCLQTVFNGKSSCFNSYKYHSLKILYKGVYQLMVLTSLTANQMRGIVIAFVLFFSVENCSGRYHRRGLSYHNPR